MASCLFACYFAVVIGAINGFHTCDHASQRPGVSTNGCANAASDNGPAIWNDQPAAHDGGPCAACAFIRANQTPGTMPAADLAIDDELPVTPLGPGLTPPTAGEPLAFLARGPPISCSV